MLSLDLLITRKGPLLIKLIAFTASKSYKSFGGDWEVFTKHEEIPFADLLHRYKYLVPVLSHK